MKKVLVLILASMMVLTLTGCGNKSTSVSNPNEVLIQVGGTKITRQTLYENFKDYDQGAVLSSLLDEIIVNKEIATTDEMLADVDSQIAELVESDELEETLDNYGMDEEEYREYLLNSIKGPKLYEKYIENNYDKLYEDYLPFKAKLIMCEVGEDESIADDKIIAALADLKSGRSFEDVAADYSDDLELAEETLYTREDVKDSSILEWYINHTETNLSDRIISEDADKLYIVQVVENRKSFIKDDFTEYLENNEEFSCTVLTYYSEQNNVQLYDIDYYNYFKENYEDYLWKSAE